MSVNNYILQIPEPCNQDWNRMRATSTGKFCSLCSKNLIDFASLTDAEIIRLLEQSQGQLCGRLDAGQLNRVLIDKQVKFQNKHSLKKIGAALLILITVRDIKAAGAPAQQASIQWQYNSIPGNKDNSDTSTATALTGTVIDSADKDPIIMATVKNLTRQTGQLTDADGHFSIEAAVGDKIQIMYLGYNADKFTVTDFVHKTYTLSPMPISMNTTVGIIVTTHPSTQTLYKPSLKSRIRRFFGIKDKD